MDMVNENIKLAGRQADFIQQLIKSGRYGNINEVVRASVLLLEEHVAQEERQKEKLRAMLDDAFAGGLSERSPQDIWDAAEARYLEENA